MCNDMKVVKQRGQKEHSKQSFIAKFCLFCLGEGFSYVFSSRGE